MSGPLASTEATALSIGTQTGLRDVPCSQRQTKSNIRHFLRQITLRPLRNRDRARNARLISYSVNSLSTSFLGYDAARFDRWNVTRTVNTRSVPIHHPTVPYRAHRRCTIAENPFQIWQQIRTIPNGTVSIPPSSSCGRG